MPITYHHCHNRANMPVLTEEQFIKGLRYKKNNYDHENKKKNSKYTDEYSLVQKTLKIVQKEIVLDFN